MIVSTVIFTLSHTLAIPRTLSLEKREGSGRVFLDTSTVFYPEWQLQLRVVVEAVGAHFDTTLRDDFVISVNSPAVDGWSTSLPLFLLFASALSGEELPSSVFSTGCMYSPDGFISYGKPKGIQAKIDTLEALAKNTGIEKPIFLIPFSPFAYQSTRVQLCRVRTAFSALEKALPHTYERYAHNQEKLSSVTAHDTLKDVITYIPEKGDVFVLISDEKKEKEFSQTDVEGVPFIVETLPPDHPVYLYFIRDRTVFFRYSFQRKTMGMEAASAYKEVLYGSTGL